MTDQEPGLAVSIRAELDRFEEAMRGAGRLVETTTTGMDKATKRAADTFKRLEGALDPAARALTRLERDTAKVQNALAKGAVSTERAAHLQKQLNDQYQRTIQHLNDVAPAGTRGMGSMRSMGAAVQQAGYQVGDFAVQVASGQDPLRAFIQQGTQLVSMFGPMGAVIGAVGSILGAVAVSFLMTKDATEKAAKGVNAYEDALNSVASAQEEVRELQEKLNGSFRDASLTKLDMQADALRKKIVESARDPAQARKTADELTKLMLERVDLVNALAEKERAEGDLAVASLRRQADAQSMLNDMVRMGALDLDRMKFAQDALEKGMTIGSDRFNAYVDQAAALESLKEEFKETRPEVDRFAEALSRTVAGMETETAALRLESSGRAEAAEWLREEVRLREQLGPLYDGNASKLRGLWDEQRRLNEEIKAGQDANRQAQRDMDAIAKARGNVQVAEMRADAAGIADPRARQAMEEMADRQREINRLTAEYGTVASGTGQQLLALWDQETAAQSRAKDLTEQHKAAMDELSGFADRAFDRIGNAVTTMFVEGKGEAVSWKNVVSGVISEVYQEFMKLTIMNPLKNMLFGSSLPTLGSFGGLFGGGGGAGTLMTPVATIHTGGIHGDPMARRMDSPAAYANAPRFHDGRVPNLLPGEMRAIIKQDEGVFTPRQMRALGRMAGGGAPSAPPVILNQSIDLRGSDAGVFAKAQAFKDQIKRETVQAVMDMMNGGGRMALASGRRKG